VLTDTGTDRHKRTLPTGLRVYRVRNNALRVIIVTFWCSRSQDDIAYNVRTTLTHFKAKFYNLMQNVYGAS